MTNEEKLEYIKKNYITARMYELLNEEKEIFYEEMYWIPIKDLDKYRTFPNFFKDYLKEEHKEVVHIVTDDRKHK